MLYHPEFENYKEKDFNYTAKNKLYNMNLEITNEKERYFLFILLRDKKIDANTREILMNIFKGAKIETTDLIGLEMFKNELFLEEFIETLEILNINIILLDKLNSFLLDKFKGNEQFNLHELCFLKKYFLARNFIMLNLSKICEKFVILNYLKDGIEILCNSHETQICIKLMDDTTLSTRTFYENDFNTKEMFYLYYFTHYNLSKIENWINEANLPYFLEVAAYSDNLLFYVEKFLYLILCNQKNIFRTSEILNCYTKTKNRIINFNKCIKLLDETFKLEKINEPEELHRISEFMKELFKKTPKNYRDRFFNLVSRLRNIEYVYFEQQFIRYLSSFNINYYAIFLSNSDEFIPVEKLKKILDKKDLFNFFKEFFRNLKTSDFTYTEIGHKDNSLKKHDFFKELEDFNNLDCDSDLENSILLHCSNIPIKTEKKKPENTIFDICFNYTKFYQNFVILKNKKVLENFIIRFMHMISDSNDPDYIYLLPLVPYIPPTNEGFRLVYYLYLILYKYGIPDLFVFNLKTPALLIDTIIPIIDDSILDNINSTTTIMNELGIYDSPSIICYLGIIYYSELVKLKNYNFSGIFQYTTNMKILSHLKENLILLMRGIHENSVFNNSTFNERYLSHILYFLLKKYKYNYCIYHTTEVILIQVIKILVCKDETLLYKAFLYKILSFIISQENNYFSNNLENYIDLLEFIFTKLRKTPYTLNYILTHHSNFNYFSKFIVPLGITNYDLFKDSINQYINRINWFPYYVEFNSNNEPINSTRESISICEPIKNTCESISICEPINNTRESITIGEPITIQCNRRVTYNPFINKDYNEMYLSFKGKDLLFLKECLFLKDNLTNTINFLKLRFLLENNFTDLSILMHLSNNEYNSDFYAYIYVLNRNSKLDTLKSQGLYKYYFDSKAPVCNSKEESVLYNNYFMMRIFHNKSRKLIWMNEVKCIGMDYLQLLGFTSSINSTDLNHSITPVNEPDLNISDTNVLSNPNNSSNFTVTTTNTGTNNNLGTDNNPGTDITLNPDTNKGTNTGTNTGTKEESTLFSKFRDTPNINNQSLLLEQLQYNKEESSVYKEQQVLFNGSINTNEYLMAALERRVINQQSNKLSIDLINDPFVFRLLSYLFTSNIKISNEVLKQQVIVFDNGFNFIINDIYITQDTITPIDLILLINSDTLSSEIYLFYLSIINDSIIELLIPQLVLSLKNNLSIIKVFKSREIIHRVLYSLRSNICDNCNLLIYNIHRDSILKGKPQNLEIHCNDCKIFNSCYFTLLNNDSSYLKQLRFINQLKDISQLLFENRLASKFSKINLLEQQISNLDCTDIYFPFDYSYSITGTVNNSCNVLQSATRVPFLFSVILNDCSTKNIIVKIGDDCRQDMLTLQLMNLFNEIFIKNNLDIKLFPYKVITIKEIALIECVRNAKTRDQLGKEGYDTLIKYFESLFGFTESKEYDTALNEFVSTFVGYSLLTYFINVKDRHNANIMINDKGNLIHIDFGFIMEISPGNLNFELPVKLTTELHNLLKSGTKDYFSIYKQRMVDGFLCIRKYHKEIFSLCKPFAYLPCFKTNGLANLTLRFKFELSEEQCKKFVLTLIDVAKDSKRTWIYDTFQYLTNDIRF